MHKTTRSILAALLILFIFVTFISVAPTIAQELPHSEAPSTSEQSVTLVRVTPEGDTQEIPDQIVLQFDRAVVPLGRMERSTSEIDIEITPRLNCNWRWLNTSALACSLNDADRPKPATQYTLTIPKDFDSSRGPVLATSHTHSLQHRDPPCRIHGSCVGLGPENQFLT